MIRIMYIVYIHTHKNKQQQNKTIKTLYKHFFCSPAFNPAMEHMQGNLISSIFSLELLYYFPSVYI